MPATLVDPAPPDRLRQRSPQHTVLVLDAGVAHPAPSQPGVPPLDVADRQAGERSRAIGPS